MSHGAQPAGEGARYGHNGIFRALEYNDKVEPVQFANTDLKVISTENVCTYT